MGDSNLVVNCMNGRWKINNQKFRAEVQKTQNLLDRRDIRPMADHLDLFQSIYRDWHEKADRLTHEAREKGASWNSFTMKEGSKVESVEAARAICCEQYTHKYSTYRVAHHDHISSREHARLKSCKAQDCTSLCP